MHTGAPTNVLKGFFCECTPVCRRLLSPWKQVAKERFLRLLCAGQPLTVSVSPLLRISCSKLICFLTEAGPPAVTTGGLCSRSRDDTEIAEGVGGQTVSQELIYLTEVFFKRHHVTKKGSVEPEHRHLLHAVFSFCHLHNWCKKLLKMERGFGDLLTRR